MIFFRAESFETTRQCHQTVWGSEELLEADSWTSNRKKVKDERLRKSSNCSSTLIKIGSNHGKCSIKYQFGCGISKMVGPKKQDFWNVVTRFQGFPLIF